MNIATSVPLSFATELAKSPVYFQVTSNQVGTCAEEKAQANSLCQTSAIGYKCYFRDYVAQGEFSRVDSACADLKKSDPDLELSDDGLKCGKWAEGVDCFPYSANCFCSDKMPSADLFRNDLMPLEIPLGLSINQALKQLE